MLLTSLVRKHVYSYISENNFGSSNQILFPPVIKWTALKKAGIKWTALKIGRNIIKWTALKIGRNIL
jgi:hypothetical protein